MVDSPATPPDVLFEQARSGIFTAETLAWLSAGFVKYERNGEALSLERCLQIRTHAQRRRQMRDYYLGQAAGYLQQQALPDVAEALGRELDNFSAACWREWKSRADPPPGATPLRQALFAALKALDGKPRPCNKRLEQILSETFPA